MAVEWKDIRTAPVGPTILLANNVTGDVFTGYGEFSGTRPMPIWNAVDPNGFGRCKPTHWAEMPSIERAAQ